MVIFKTQEEIEKLRRSSLLVSKTLAELAKSIKPGLPSRKLDEIAETFIRDHGAEPGFKGFGGFPWTLCISTNAEVVHGMPSDREIQDGDVLSIDCGVKLDGYYGDSAYSFLVGNVSEEVHILCRRTKASLYKGIEQAIVGNRLGDVSFAIQNATEKAYGYGVVRELVGHGIGRDLHEEPQIPNYGKRGKGVKLQKGMVLAIEPMINLGKRAVVQLKDGWTITTADGQVSAHYEHDVAVMHEQADILSTFELIEEVERTNKELTSVDITEEVNG